jgi:hypothetical protein
VLIDLATQTPAQATSLAIDVTIPHVSLASAMKSLPSTPLIYRTHLGSIRAKLVGRSSVDNSPDPAFIQTLLDHRMAVIPFSVNHLGGLGPFSLELLFAPASSPAPPFPPIPASAFNPPPPRRTCLYCCLFVL